jgi:predicted PurR-regulated permease PerM
MYCVLWVAAEIVVPLLLAMVLKLMLQPAMRLLSDRMKLPVGVSAFVLIVALFGVLAAVGLAIAVPASGWIAKAPQGLKTLQDQLRLLRGPLAAAQYLLQQAEHLAEPAGASGNAPVAATASSTGLGNVGISILMGTQYFFGRLIVLVVTLFFMLAAGDSMLRKLVEVVPTFRRKKDVVTITNEIERNVSGYLATITAINAAVGVVTGCAMYACGIADPLLWGTVAFLLNFIPILGPLIGVGTIFLVGLLTFGHALPALLPALIYLGVHITEGQLVTPMLLARQFTLSPVLVIISLFFWHWMWGIPGALLSVPLLATFKIVCDRIPSLAPLGHMLGAPNQRANSDRD